MLCVHATLGTKQHTITDIQIDTATADTMWMCKQTRKHMQTLHHGPTYNTHTTLIVLFPGILAGDPLKLTITVL